MSGPSPDLIVTAPNGTAWKRLPGGTSSGPEFLAVLAIFADTGGRIAREWNWWQDGQQAREDERIREMIRQWDQAEPPPGGYLTAGQLEARLDASQAERDWARQACADLYDEDLAMARLRLLSAQATCGFMRHVLASQARHCRPAGPGTRVPGRQRGRSRGPCRPGPRPRHHRGQTR
jgi:hypothetical protein